MFSIGLISVAAGVSFAQIKLRNALDFDGDSKADVGVFRNSDNGWYVLKSNGSGYVGQAFGSAHTDTTAPGDYDGDGKTDVAVWRETDGTFYVLNSNGGSVSATPWGFTSDAPIAAYDSH